MADMTDPTSTKKTTAKELRRRRILMNDEDEGDGTPNKIESFNESKTTFTSYIDTDHSTSVSGSEKQIAIVVDLEDVSVKDMHFTTSDENANELDSQNHSLSTKEEKQVNDLQTKKLQNKREEDLTNYNNDPGVQSKRTRFATTAHMPAVDTSEDEIQTKTDKILKDVDIEVLDSIEKREFPDKEDSDTILIRSQYDDGLMQISEGDTLPRRADEKNSEDLSLPNIYTNQQEIIHRRHDEEISPMMETLMETIERPNEDPGEGNRNILQQQITQQVAIKEFSEENFEKKLRDTNEDTKRELDLVTPSSTPVTVKRKVRFLAYHREVRLLDKKWVETDNRNNRAVSKTSATQVYKETMSDLESVGLPSKANGHTLSVNQVFENVSISKSEVLEGSRVQNDRVDEVLKKQTTNTKILPAQQPLHTPVARSDLHSHTASETLDKTQQEGERKTNKYRVHCYLELSPVLKRDERKLTRKWKSEPTLNLRQPRKRSKSLNLEKNIVQKRSSIVIELKKPTTHRPLVPAYSLNVQPFETVIRNQVNLKLKKNRRKSYPPPTADQFDYLISHVSGFHEVQTQETERKNIVLHKSHEILKTLPGDETDFKSYEDDVFNKENNSVDDLGPNHKIWTDIHQPSITGGKIRNKETIGENFEEKSPKPHLNVASLTIRPKSFKELTHVAEVRTHSGDITFGRVESTTKYNVHHDVTSEKPRNEIVIEEMPPGHTSVPKKARLDHEELILAKRKVPDLAETADFHTPTWHSNEKTLFKHEEINEAKQQQVDNRQEVQLPELDVNQPTSNSIGTQTILESFEPSEKSRGEESFVPVKRWHKPLQEPAVKEEPHLFPASEQPALSRVLVSEDQPYKEEKNILNIERYLESTDNEYATKGLRSGGGSCTKKPLPYYTNDSSEIYNHPSSPTKSEERTIEQQNADMPEANMTDELTPPHEILKSQTSIDVQRFLKNTAENGKGRGDNAKTEENFESVEPYQANLEIQRLLEKMSESDEELFQSHPVYKQQDIQVILLDETKKRRKKSKKSSEKVPPREISEEGKEEDQMTCATPIHVDVTKIQRDEDRPKTIEQAIQTLITPEYMDVDVEDQSDLVISGFQPRPGTQDFLINTIPEEHCESSSPTQHLNDLTPGDIGELDEPVEPRYEPTFKKQHFSPRKIAEMKDQTTRTYENEKTVKTSVRREFALKESRSKNEEPWQTPPEKKAVDSVKEEQELIKPIHKPRYQTQDIIPELHTRKEERPIQPLPFEKEGESVARLAELEPTNTLHQQRYGIQEITLGGTIRNDKPIKPARVKKPEKSTAKIVEQEPAKQLYQPRYEIQDFVFEEQTQGIEQPVQQRLIENPEKFVAHLLNEEPDSMEPGYQPRYEIRDYVSEVYPERKEDPVQLLPDAKQEDLVIRLTQEQQEPEKSIYLPGYEIHDSVSEECAQRNGELLEPPPVKKRRKTAGFLTKEEPKSTKAIYQLRNEIQDNLLEEHTQRKENKVPTIPVKKPTKSEFQLVQEDPDPTKPDNNPIYKIQDFVLEERNQREDEPIYAQLNEKADKTEVHLLEKEHEPMEPTYKQKYELQDFVLEEHKLKKEEPGQLPRAEKIETFVVRPTNGKPIPMKQTYQPSDAIRHLVSGEYSVSQKDEPEPIKQRYGRDVDIKTFVPEGALELEKATISPRSYNKPEKMRSNLTKQIPDQTQTSPKYDRTVDLERFVEHDKLELKKEAGLIRLTKQAGEAMVNLVKENTPRHERKMDMQTFSVEETPEPIKPKYERNTDIHTFIVEETAEIEKDTVSILPFKETQKASVDLVKEMPEAVNITNEKKVDIRPFLGEETPEMQKETTTSRTIKEAGEITVILKEETPEPVKPRCERKVDIQTFVIEETPQIEKNTIPIHSVKDVVNLVEVELVKPKHDRNVGIQTFVIQETPEVVKEPSPIHPIKEPGQEIADLVEEIPEPTKSTYERNIEIQTLALEEKTALEKDTISTRPIKNSEEITVSLAELAREPITPRQERKVDIPTFVVDETPEIEKETVSIRPSKETQKATVDEVNEMREPLKPKYEREVDIQRFVLEETPDIQRETISIRPLKKENEITVSLVEEIPQSITRGDKGKGEIQTFVTNKPQEIKKETISIRPSKETQKETVGVMEKMPEYDSIKYDRKVDVQRFVLEETPEFQKETKSVGPVKDADEITVSFGVQMSEPLKPTLERKAEIQTFVIEETPEIEKNTLSIYGVREPIKDIVDLVERAEPVKPRHDTKVDIQTFVIQETPEVVKEAIPISPIKEPGQDTVDLVEEMPEPIKPTYERKTDIQMLALEEKTLIEKETNSTHPIKNSEEINVNLPELAKEPVTPRQERKVGIQTFAVDETTEIEKETVSICPIGEETQKAIVEVVEKMPEHDSVKYDRKVDVQRFVLEETPEFQKETKSVGPVKDADEITVSFEVKVSEPLKPTLERKAEIQTFIIEETSEIEKDTLSIHPEKEQIKEVVDLVERAEPVKPRHDTKVDIQTFVIQETPEVVKEPSPIHPIKEPGQEIADLVEEIPKPITPAYERNSDIQMLALEEKTALEKETTSTRPIKNSVEVSQSVSLVELAKEPTTPRQERKVDIPTFVVDETPEIEKETILIRPSKETQKATVDEVNEMREPLKPKYEREVDIQRFVLEETPDIQRETISIRPLNKENEITVSLVEEIPQSITRGDKGKGEIQTFVTNKPQEIEKETISIHPIKGSRKVTSELLEKMPEVKPTYERNTDIQTFTLQEKPELGEEITSTHPKRNLKEIDVNLYQLSPEPVTPKQERKADNQTPVLDETRQKEKETVSIHPITEIQKVTVGLTEEMSEPALEMPGLQKEVSLIRPVSEPEEITVSVEEEIPELINQKHEKTQHNQTYVKDETSKSQKQTISTSPTQKTEKATIDFVAETPKLEQSTVTHFQVDDKTDDESLMNSGEPWMTVRRKGTKNKDWKKPQQKLRAKVEERITFDGQQVADDSESFPECENILTDDNNELLKDERSGIEGTTPGTNVWLTVRMKRWESNLRKVNREKCDLNKQKPSQHSNSTISIDGNFDESSPSIILASRGGSPTSDKEDAITTSRSDDMVDFKNGLNPGVQRNIRDYPLERMPKYSLPSETDDENFRDSGEPWITVKRKQARNQNWSKQKLPEYSVSTVSIDGSVDEDSSSTRSSSRAQTPTLDVSWKSESSSEDPWISVRRKNKSFDDKKIRITPHIGDRVIEESVPLHDNTDGKNVVENQSHNPTVGEHVAVTEQGSTKETLNLQKPLNRPRDYVQENGKSFDGFQKREISEKPLLQSRSTQLKLEEKGSMIPKVDSPDNFGTTKTDDRHSTVYSDLKTLPWVEVGKHDSAKKRFSISKKKKQHDVTLRGLHTTDGKDHLLLLKIPTNILAKIENDEQMLDTDVEIPWMELDPSSGETHGYLPWVELTDQIGDTKTDRLLMLKVPREMILKASKKSTKQEHQIHLPWNEVIRYWEETGQIPDGSLQGKQRERSSSLSLTFPNEGDLEKPGAATTLQQSFNMPDIRLVLPKKCCVDSSLLAKPMITLNPNKNIQLRIKKKVKRKYDWRSTLRLSKSDRNKNYLQVHSQDRWVMLADGTTWWRLQMDDIDDFEHIKPRSDGKHFENSYEIGDSNNDREDTINLNQFSKEIGRQKKIFSFVNDPKNSF